MPLPPRRWYWPAFSHHLIVILRRYTQHRLLAPLVGLIALLLGITVVVPFTPVLMAVIVMVPGQRVALWLWSAVGTAIGMWITAAAVHWYGPSLVDTYFPGTIGNAQWLSYQGWMTQWGEGALFLMGSTPLPQLPMLVMAGLSDLSLWSIALTLLGSKLVKYAMITGATSFLSQLARRPWRRKS